MNKLLRNIEQFNYVHVVIFLPLITLKNSVEVPPALVPYLMVGCPTRSSADLMVITSFSMVRKAARLAV